MFEDDFRDVEMRRNLKKSLTSNRKDSGWLVIARMKGKKHFWFRKASFSILKLENDEKRRCATSFRSNGGCGG